MSNPEINLTELHTAIKAALAAKFAGVHVDFYERDLEKVPTPAIRFELAGISPAQEPDLGTDQLAATLRFSAEVIYSYKKGSKLAVRVMAASLAQFVTGQKFGKPVMSGRFVDASPDVFADEYETWRVEWEHDAFLGPDVWETIGQLPNTVLVGESPKVGAAFEPDYVSTK